jgi:hypothetical protein
LILFVALVFLGANLRGTSKKALIVIVVVFLLGTVAALAFAHYQHQTIATDRCLQNLAQIDAAKIIWFGDNGSNAIPSLKDLKDGYPTYRATFASTEPFQIWGTNGQPVCPAGGTYTVGKTGEPPSCSIHGTATWSSWCDQHPHRY